MWVVWGVSIGMVSWISRLCSRLSQEMVEAWLEAVSWTDMVDLGFVEWPTPKKWTFVCMREKGEDSERKHRYGGSPFEGADDRLFSVHDSHCYSEIDDRL